MDDDKVIKMKVGIIVYSIDPETVWKYFKY
jgi:hypothetical protein